jgi:hypothetical protein
MPLPLATSAWAVAAMSLVMSDLLPSLAAGRAHRARQGKLVPRGGGLRRSVPISVEQRGRSRFRGE